MSNLIVAPSKSKRSRRPKNSCRVAEAEAASLAAIRVARKFGLSLTTAALLCRLAHLGQEGGANG